MKTLSERYSVENKQVKIRLRIIDWSDYYKTLQRSLAENDPTALPDLAIVHLSKAATFDTAKLQDFRALKEAKIPWQDFTEELQAHGEHLAARYFLPLDKHGLIMYYNTDLLAKADLLDQKQKPIIQPGADGFFQFLTAAKKKLPSITLAFSSPSNNVYPFWLWYVFYNQIEGGGDYITNNQAAFNNAAGRKALDTLGRLIDTGLWQKNIHDARGYNLFKYEGAPVIFSGVWSTWNFEQNTKLRFETMPIPTLFDKPATWSDNHALMIPKAQSAERKLAAAIFANWLSDQGVYWAAAGHVPVKKSVLASLNYQKLTKRSNFNNYLKDSVQYPKHQKLRACNEIMIKLLVEFVEGKRNSEITLDLAEEQINRLLSSSQE